jgi:hypothetical protein
LIFSPSTKQLRKGILAGVVKKDGKVELLRRRMAESTRQALP